jgi:UDP-N-acetylglucosamine 4,6-dehydratase
MSFFTGKSILVTGGTGSFGKAFAREVLDCHNPRRLIIFSRDELKQYEMRRDFKNDSRLRWFIGDVRDQSRLERALSGVDYVVHAAAMKQVDTAEYNPFECIATNVLGAENVINACINLNVQRVVALSTDKASSPINLYGASKLCSDKLFVAGNYYAAHSDTKFSVVRYGNVVGSRGSVVPLFRDLVSSGVLPITDEAMTRFWITLPQAVNFVIESFAMMMGGEIFVPRIPSTRVVDLAKAIGPNAKIKVIGIRPGEKMHEEMISEHDAFRTFELADRYVIAPVTEGQSEPVAYVGGHPVRPGFSYQSDSNDWMLTIDEIRELLDSVSLLPA